MFTHQWNAVQIENHSWHRSDDGRTLEAPGPLAEAALSNAAAQGRSGAGRIFVWAAGDGRIQGDNCNFDGYANSRFGIAVGAVDDTGRQAFYSEACSALLVSAPSSGVPGVSRGLMTSDLVDADGFDPSDYTSAFGGTAAAAPVVSGVVALMLARNPTLTWRDVQHILVRTSRPVDAGDTSWTSGPFPHSEKYGFGVVDAAAAVRAAARWTNVPAERVTRAVTHAVGVPIADNNPAGVSDEIWIGPEYAGFSVEHVDVEFTAGHPHRGDLEVTLTSPDGIVSHLAPARPGDSGVDFSAWRFRSVRHWGESAAGTWTLTVTDRAAGNVGIFSGWSLRIYGTGPATTPPPTPTPTPKPRPTPPTLTPPPALTPMPGPDPASPSTPTPTPGRTAIVVTANPTAIWSSLAPAPATGAETAKAPATPQDAATATLMHEAAGTALFSGWYPGVVGAAPQSAPVDRASAAPGIPSSPNGEEGIDASSSRQPDPTPNASGPRAPANLVASVSGSTIVLKWGLPASGSTPTNYILEAGFTAGASDLFVSPTGSAATTFTSRGADAGTYFVRVRASNAGGTSEPSNEVEVKVVVSASGSASCTAAPSTPNGLRSSVSGSTVTLAWDGSTPGPTSYVIEPWWGADGKKSASRDTGGIATTLTADGVAPGTYVVRVRARNACGSSAPSRKVTITVRGAAGPGGTTSSRRGRSD